MAVPSPQLAAELKRKALLWLERFDARIEKSTGTVLRRKGDKEARSEER
jgi:hypothetical protein